MHLKAKGIESVEREKVVEDGLSGKLLTFIKEHEEKAFSPLLLGAFLVALGWGYSILVFLKNIFY